MCSSSDSPPSTEIAKKWRSALEEVQLVPPFDYSVASWRLPCKYSTLGSIYFTELNPISWLFHIFPHPLYNPVLSTLIEALVVDWSNEAVTLEGPAAQTIHTIDKPLGLIQPTYSNNYHADSNEVSMQNSVKLAHGTYVNHNTGQDLTYSYLCTINNSSILQGVFTP